MHPQPTEAQWHNVPPKPCRRADDVALECTEPSPAKHTDKAVDMVQQWPHPGLERASEAREPVRVEVARLIGLQTGLISHVEC